VEYFLITVLTFALTWSIISIVNKRKINLFSKIKYRQSNVHEIVKNVIPKEMFEKPKKIRQSEKHIQKNMLKVIITDGMAYWTANNVFYSAKSINGRVDESTIRPLDVHDLSKKELAKMMDILDSLRNGVEQDDSGGARY
jgi:uncharacterized protein YeeX (DUF496 family)